MGARRPGAQGGLLSPSRAGLEELRGFVAVARTGSVVAAARALHRSQPAVSARLAALERTWETSLFTRSARGMVLTPEGRALLPRAEALLKGMQELEQAAGLPASPADELRLGAGDALGRVLLPRALARLLRDRPGLEIRLREGSRPALLSALGRGEIDLALVVGAAGDPVPAGAESAALVASEVILLAPRGRRARRTPWTARALAGERLVSLQPGSGFRRHLEAAFAAAGAPLRPAVEVGNLSLVRRFVASGLGLAPVPAVAFPAGGRLPGVRAEALEGIPPVSYLRVVRAGAPLPPSAAALLSLLGPAPAAGS